jgi:hypothetical protein
MLAVDEGVWLQHMHGLVHQGDMRAAAKSSGN